MILFGNDGVRHMTAVSAHAHRPLVPIAARDARAVPLGAAGDGGKPVRVAVIGSSGSIGTQTLDVLAHLGHPWQVYAVVASTSADVIAGQIARFQPNIVGIDVPLPDNVGHGPALEVLSSAEATAHLATDPNVDVLVVASSGHHAIGPTLAALRAGKIVALANKETVVCAGGLVADAIAAGGGELRPVDSEHSAIWQSLGQSPASSIARLLVTASGGPFRGWSREQLRNVTVEQALAHPTWKMGGKISIDSATLINKGLELIEAGWLFGVGVEQLEVIIHPESIVHSLVEFPDRSQIAQLSLPDMRLPIQYALTYPDHTASPCRMLSLADVGHLTFERADPAKLPGIGLALDAMRSGGTYPTVLSAVDEVAVAAFLRGELSFLGITEVIADVLDRHTANASLDLDAIMAADQWARTEAETAIRTRR